MKHDRAIFISSGASDVFDTPFAILIIKDKISFLSFIFDGSFCHQQEIFGKFTH
ncbi:hypothetical protein ACQFX9_19475 [Aliinostoc sp. HNIBRCY26]|uniref:hypothetical protein n=1 Tax=Aliinostoc sp. HNIBRCY26 TaxID=3418997 RepID=UPI003D038DA3